MKPPHKYSGFNHLADLAERAKARNDPNIQSLLLATAITESRSLVNATSKILGLKAAVEEIEQFPFETPQESSLNPQNTPAPKILMGVVKRLATAFFYLIDYLCMHALVLGAPGTGKTNLFYAILAQLMAMNIPILVIDKDKQDYRVLKKLFPNLVVLRADKDLIYNTLQVPPGVPPKYWLTKWVEIFSGSCGLMVASKSMLIKALNELFEQMGVFNGSGNYPTTLDLLNKVQSYNLKGKYRSAQFQDTIINRLYAFNYQLGECCSYSQGISIDWIGQTPLVIEVKGVSDFIGRFLIATILFALMFRRIAANQRGEGLSHATCIDEAHWINADSPDAKKYTPISTLMAQCREFGMGLLVGSQSAIPLEPAMFVNSSLGVCFRLGSGLDIKEVRNAFALSPEQADYIPRMGLGEAIVRIPKEYPFVIQTLKTNFG